MTTRMVYNAEFPNGKRVNFTAEENTARELVAIEDAKKFKESQANEYARIRATEFPALAEQLDMQYHDQLDGTTTWKDAIAKVKSDNPKPE